MGRAAAKKKEKNIRLEGMEIKQGNRFEYLGETVIGDGKSEAEVQRRIQQSRLNAWAHWEVAQGPIILGAP